MAAPMLAVLLASIPGSAGAATVRIDGLQGGGSQLTFDDDAGDANDVLLSRSGGSYVILDHGAAISTPAGGGCSHPSSDPQLAQCPDATVRSVVILLGTQADRLTIDDSASPPVSPPPNRFAIRVTGGEGKDVIVGSLAAEDLDGEDDADKIWGAGGDDQITGGDGDDPVLDGGPGNDDVQGAQGDDIITGGPGDDNALWGGDGGDTIDGGEGDDEVRGGDGQDQMSGGPGNDRFDFPLFEIDQSGGADAVDGGPGDDAMYGGPDEKAQPADVFSGGDGIDTADFSDRSAPLTIDLDGRDGDGESGEDDNVQDDVENVIGGSNDDTLTGSDASNVLDGRAGEDTIAGRDGDDVLRGGVNDPSGDDLSGGAGVDTMLGGPGDDSLAGGEGNDVESGGGGTDTVEGGNGDDSLTGGAGTDTVNGEDGNDTLYGGEPGLVGGDGRDELNGGRGRDWLFGGRGNDELDGGPGPDYISGETEKDTVTYDGRTSQVTVTLDGKADDGEDGEGDNVLADVEVIVGGIRGDELAGDTDANTIDAGRGEDLIDGNLGADRLLGGDAPDVVRARDGVRDEVIACGDGGDLVIADDNDKTVECETVDRPSTHRVAVRRYALLEAQGEFGLRLPQGLRYFPLVENVKIPIGSTLDPKKGVLQVATARNRTGGQQFASVSEGRFMVLQRGDRRPVTELQLAGPLPDCRGSSARQRAAKRRPPRKLRVDERKNKRKVVRLVVRGKYSTAAPRGTAWMTEDRCDGTLTRVESGSVRVTDLVRHKVVTVRAGKEYLARAR